METGLRVLRNKNRFRNLVIGVLCALALVATPATSVFAYPSNVSSVSVTVSNIASGWGFLDESATWGDTDGNAVTNGLYTIKFPISFYYGVSYTDIGDGNIAYGLFDIQLNFTFPTFQGMTIEATSMEVESSGMNEGLIAVTVEPRVISTGKNSVVRVSWYSYMQRPQFGGYIALNLIATYRNTSSQIDPRSIFHTAATYDSYSVSNNSAAYMPVTDLLPDLHDIREGLLDPSTGWLPTMNTNLQTMVTNQITANSWLNSIYGQEQVANSHLSDIKTNQVQQIGNQQTQINQLQQIVDYVNSTVAADKVADANQDFVGEAASLEAGQNNLENAADASLAAVDTSKINLIGTYSQSITWWMRVINWLPTGTGAIWDVVVFGFLIAFLLFILRLVR